MDVSRWIIRWGGHTKIHGNNIQLPFFIEMKHKSEFFNITSADWWHYMSSVKRYDVERVTMLRFVGHFNVMQNTGSGAIVFSSQNRNLKID